MGEAMIIDSSKVHINREMGLLSFCPAQIEITGSEGIVVTGYKCVPYL
jgi:hypothetical protein